MHLTIYISECNTQHICPSCVLKQFRLKDKHRLVITDIKSSVNDDTELHLRLFLVTLRFLIEPIKSTVITVLCAQ